MAKFKEFGERVLIDPTSALYYMGSGPSAGWARISHSSAPTFGWIFSAEINAKNRMGGYVGRREYIMLYKNGSLLPVTFDHTTRYGTPVNYPYGLK
ncbi:MAG: hypothetical protein HQK63_15065 [Desulfamplus sp.]|nr:hypothetical protein [Desulfamplus sp.]